MKNAKQMIIDLLYYTAGCILFSAAVTVILEPNNISPGGVIGIATILNSTLAIPTGVTVFVINIPILLVAFKVLGGNFIVKTGIVTVISSVMLQIGESFLPKWQLDGIIAAIFGGIMMGTGISLVFLRGATTGGIDIIAKLINRKSRHLTVGRLVLTMDAFVVLLSIFVYKSVQSGLYTIISIYASSKILDAILYGSDGGHLIYVITKSNLLAKQITMQLERGVTVISAKGAYSNQEQQVILCAIRKYEIQRFRREVKKSDPNAFIIVANVGEILGEGFKKLD